MRNKAIKFVFITGEDPHDQGSWSGTLYYLSKALEEKGCELMYVGPAKPTLAWLIGAFVNKVSMTIVGKRFDYRHSIMYAKAYGRLFTKRVKGLKYDAILCVGGSEFLSYLETAKPTILIADRTIAGAIEYHKVLSNLLKWSESQSILTDERAMKKTILNVFASDWAMKGALLNYKLDPNRNIVIPFGANLKSIPNEEDIELRLQQTEVCKLLFIGTNWINKGGDIAITCLKRLQSLGLKCELYVVGCSLPSDMNESGVVEVGYLDKNNNTEYDQLKELYLQSHFFILPTRFEAYGLVFTEAAAFGLPSIGRNTGGVSSAMGNGLGGELMAFDAGGEDYANVLYAWWLDKNRYKESIRTAHALFKNRLNWNQWTTDFLAKVSSSIQLDDGS